MCVVAAVFWRWGKIKKLWCAAGKKRRPLEGASIGVGATILGRPVLIWARNMGSNSGIKALFANLRIREFCKRVCAWGSASLYLPLLLCALV